MKPERTLRVLYIDHTAKIGGGEIALFNLVRYIDRSAVEPLVLLFEDGPLHDRLIPVATTRVLSLDSAVAKANKDALGVGSLFKLKAVWLTLRHIVRVASFLRSEQIDVVHTNSLKADIIGGFAAKLAGVPVVWHVRDRIDADYLPRFVVVLFRLLSRFIPDFVIANSQATLDTVQLHGRRPSAAIGSGVDLSASQDLKVEDVSEGAGPRIGLVGRISPWKGQHIFLQAAAEVLKQYPSARFQIIGAPLFAERAYEEELLQLCASLGIEHAVEFTGFVQDVPARVAALTILVHASTTGEPFGQVIIEGMAARKPVVATNGGGVPEIVQDGVTGILVPMGNASAMAAAIKQLLGDPERSARMGLLGRERVLEHFTIQKTAQMVEAVYAQMVHRRLRS